MSSLDISPADYPKAIRDGGNIYRQIYPIKEGPGKRLRVAIQECGLEFMYGCNCFTLYVRSRHEETRRVPF